MNEDEWLACDDFNEVFRRCPELIPKQRWVLWWFACCYCAWGTLSGRQKAAVEAMAATPPPSPARVTGKFLHAVRTAHSSHPSRTAEFTRLLREVIGNPFRPVGLDPAWLTSDVVALARGIYDDRAFERMPILADALQDAGCDNADVLSHCRGAGLHVRGCWVVDLILGKK